MPKPKPRETENDFVQRCIPIVLDEGTAEDGEQAVAICHSMWRDAKKNMSMNIHEQLIEEIRGRQGKTAEFNYGILTADRYVQTLQECVGSDLCYRYAAKGNVSFDDVMKKAARTLTYNGPEMELQDIYGLKSMLVDQNGDSIDLPKNTLMVFRHILSTPKKDRDGDILRTQGARVDPKMLLLWQHVHTLPIGKMLAIAEQSIKVLSLYTAIMDMNELSHDAAVMVDNDMGRFSHGFRALSFDKIKEEESKPTSPGGFDVKDWETLEESLVSIPSNTDAGTQEILLSLVEGKQLKSRMMKAVGKSIREERPVRSTVVYKETAGDYTREIEVGSVGEFEKIFQTVRKKNEDIPGDRSSKAKGEGCGCGTIPCTCTPKEANDYGNKEGKAHDDEVKSIGAGQIEGSWEYIEQKLREQAKRFLVGKGVSIGEHDYIWIIATFKDHAILSRQGGGAIDLRDHVLYYRANWNLILGEPEFIGDPKEVKIEMTTQIMDKMKAMMIEKAGRMLSKRNLNILTDVVEDLKELGRDHISTRSGKVFCEICIKKLHGVIKAAHGPGEEDEERSFEVTVKDAMAIFLAEHTPEEFEQMRKALQTMEELKVQRKQTEEYRTLVGSSWEP